MKTLWFNWHDIKRFMCKASIRAAGRCWPWLSSLDRHGYPYMRINRKVILATHVSWALHNGSRVPKYYSVAQSCGNPLCVNPHHLALTHFPDKSVKKQNLRYFKII